MKHTLAAATLLPVLLLQGCGFGSSNPPATVAGLSTRICLDPSIADETARQKDAQDKALIAFFDAHEGDTIEFCEGQFNFTSGLVMMGKRGVTIKGAGIDKTYLRFKDSTDQDGFNLNRMTGVNVEDLTIYDAPGNGLRIFRSDFVNVRHVKVGWSVADPDSPYGNYEAPDVTGQPPASWTQDGAYAFYPVICHHVLIEDSISVGSSDAGVYVGQSSDILVRRTEALHNVAGFEFENTYRAEFVDNYAHDNVGGFLVFDLPGRVQYGEKNLVHDNKSYNNNLPQFAPRGAIVAYVPSGTGALIFASDQLEFYDNDIQNNKTVGIAIANYGLADPNQSQTRYDFYPEGIHIYGNHLLDNGTNPQVPDPNRSTCTGPNGTPGPNDPPDCGTDNAQLLVTIIQAKNNGKSAQIAWDGAIDKRNSEPNDLAQEEACAGAPNGGVPVDRAGVPLTQPRAGESLLERYEARSDERGRPNLYQFDPEPVCKYNPWKFAGAETTPKKPANGLCIENNTFTLTVPGGPDDFLNFHFVTPDPTYGDNLTPGDHVVPTDCPTVAGVLLPQFVPNLGSFTPDPASDPRPSQSERDAVCNAVSPGEVNQEALLRFECPLLSQYGLFTDALDPTKNPTAPGLPYDLNTSLFSDYTVKFRFLFLPTVNGVVQKATYEDHSGCDTINVYDCYTATLGYPVGTVFAKTFAFRKDGVDDVVETRLLIKRTGRDGLPLWTGFAYEWVGEGASRQAVLKLEGNTRSASWDYDDPDPNARDAANQRPHYTGSAEHYAIPNAGACLLCHGGDDREAGASPIGPKVRNLNKTHDYGGASANQIQKMVDLGMLVIPAGRTVEAPMPKWNVPGSGDASDASLDKHLRARAWLEVNCMHCHNPGGAAQNSGLRLDAFTNPMGQDHGICKPPIAAGRAADSGTYDIQSGNSAMSILYNRVASTEAGIKMPPLARSVAQGEVLNLLADWINTTVATYADPAANYCDTTGGAPLPAAPLPAFLAPVPPTHAMKAPWG